MHTIRKVKTLVENRSIYESHEAELSIYDTYEPAQRVALSSDKLLYCGMMTGTKVLHTDAQIDTSFVPHESFVMAPGETVHIDFPDASIHSPTTCLALGIAPAKVATVCDQLNKHQPLNLGFDDWQQVNDRFLLKLHSRSTQQLLNRITESFVEGDHDRDLVLNLGVTELITRMIRQAGHNYVQQLSKINPTANGLTAVLVYIEDNLADNLDIDKLCHIACMSRSKLYVQFKHLAQSSPMEYVMLRRLDKARNMLLHANPIAEICAATGFSSASHFSRRFTQQYGLSPTEYVRGQQKPTIDGQLQ